MSDANLLGAPLVWSHEGKDYHLGVPDFDLELLFQSIHERWACNRIEALAGGVSEDAHRASLALFVEQVSTNHFAFMARLSLAFITTDHGMAEYLQLISQKGQKERGGPVLTLEFLRRLRRQKAEAWNDLTRQVLLRDFPIFQLAPAAEKSPEPEPTTASSSPS
jgi:hypothetical protein